MDTPGARWRWPSLVNAISSTYTKVEALCLVLDDVMKEGRGTSSVVNLSWGSPNMAPEMKEIIRKASLSIAITC
jgi:hypothetical protein